MPAIPQILQNCCLRADSTTYGYPGCACPSILLVYALATKFCSMTGYCEFQAQSTPPNFYKKYTLTLSAANITVDLANTPPSTGGGTEHDVDTAANGSDQDTSTPDWATTAASSYNINLANLVAASSGATSWSTYAEGDNFNPPNYYSSLAFPFKVHFVSKTHLQLQQAGGTINGIYGGFSMTATCSAGNVDINLTQQDTEADAITRATEVDTTGSAAPNSSGVFTDLPQLSVYETRNATAVNFNFITAKYALILSNLIIGMNYKVTIKIKRRTAVGDGTGDTSGYGAWSTYATDEVDFTADSAQHVVDGTWDDLNSDGLMTPNEITPTTALPSAAGYEYAVDSAFVEPA